METPKEFGNVGSTKDLITQSFVTSGGSNEAHALFIRGLALHLKLEPHEVSNILKRSVESFDKNEIHELLQKMSSYHGENANAKTRTGETLRAFKQFETTDIISALIPADQAAFKIFLANEEKYDQTTIDKALTKVWGTSDETIRYSDLKAINAELGVYNELAWWKKMPMDQKDLLISNGKDILQSFS